VNWLRISTWRPKHLLISWCLYWTLLFLGVLAPTVPALIRVSGADAKGDASLSFKDGVFSFIVNEGGSVAGSFSLRLTTLALAAAVPALLIWALWLWRTSRAREQTREKMRS
jgi:peptidoglycan biosynthesis protein MviN/MurJ (putative lipid II flippase)